MSEAPELLLHHHLKKLRLPTFLSDCPVMKNWRNNAPLKTRTMCSICFVCRSWN